MIPILYSKYILIACWLLLFLWLVPSLWLDKKTLGFLYWDCGLVILLTATLLTSLASLFQTHSIDHYWLFVIPILYMIFDFTENFLLIIKFPERLSFVTYITAGKWFFFGLSVLLMIVLFFYWLLRTKQ